MLHNAAVLCALHFALSRVPESRCWVPFCLSAHRLTP
jgi:hypothetical protein